TGIFFKLIYFLCLYVFFLRIVLSILFLLQFDFVFILDFFFIYYYWQPVSFIIQFVIFLVVLLIIHQ
ncbi:hypothetical protein C1645_793263, partial [Glomus cerebriforme]